MPRRFRTKAYAARTGSSLAQADTPSLLDASHAASTAAPDLLMRTTQAGINYAEAQRLMAIGRSQGPQALTPQQHQAIWDCLLDLPQSQRWLAEQLNALQGELNASDA